MTGVQTCALPILNKGGISGEKNGIVAEKGVNVEINGGKIIGHNEFGYAVVVDGSNAVINGGDIGYIEGLVLPGCIPISIPLIILIFSLYFFFISISIL